jgi:hypothetical protein
MAFTYINAVKDNRMTVVNDAVNSKTFVAGSGAGSAGTLVIGTSALSGSTGVLATITLPNPAFTEASQTLTLAGVPLSVSASASGTAAKAEFRNNAGTVIIPGLTVGGTAEGTASGKDIVLAASTISSGVTVTITAGTITHA